MNRLLKAFFPTLFLSGCIFAQNSDDEYKKNEFYVGYSNQQVSGGNRQTFNGFEVSAVRNFSRYFGIKGSFSGAFRNNKFQASATDPTTGDYSFTGENNRSLYNFLGGIQIKDNASKARFKPFAHALVGVAHNRFKSKTITCTSGTCPSFPPASFSDTGFGGAFGGGLDIKINDRIDFRAIQVDYNPVYSNSRVDNNVRFGIGFVFK